MRPLGSATLMLAMGAALGALTSSCAVSLGAQASAGAETGAEARGEASVELDAPAPEVSRAPAPDIYLKEGRLEYRGVINFEYDRAKLKDDAETQETLRQFAQFLAKHPEVSLQIEGHTDSRGSVEYNRDLSQRRADALRAWLVEQGVDEARLTAVGKGEDAPAVEEPPECRNTVPQDTTPCESAWATNRRVAFEVTGGKESIVDEPAPAVAPPTREPTRPIESLAVPRRCPWLVGGALGGLGPASFVGLSGVVQPAVCWLELSLGVGYRTGAIEAQAIGERGDGFYSSFVIPLRARVWFLERHSPVLDFGIGIRYISAEAQAADGDGRFSYERTAWPLVSHLALGYGFRPYGPERGFRIGVLGGAQVHLTHLSSSDQSNSGGFGNGSAELLRVALDRQTNALTRAALFAELSLGLMF